VTRTLRLTDGQITRFAEAMGLNPPPHDLSVQWALRGREAPLAPGLGHPLVGAANCRSKRRGDGNESHAGLKRSRSGDMSGTNRAKMLKTVLFARATSPRASGPGTNPGVHRVRHTPYETAEHTGARA
jgi:hypothetical protein